MQQFGQVLFIFGFIYTCISHLMWAWAFGFGYAGSIVTHSWLNAPSLAV